MKFRIIETHEPRSGSTMYTVEQAHKGWFGIGTLWATLADEPLAYCGMGGDWYAKRFISIQDASAAIEKHKQNCQPVTQRVVKEL